MCAWAKHLGAQVLGVVSKPASVERAKAAGCDQVFVFDAQSLPSQVMQATQGHKVDVVYDSIGKDTFSASLDCLRPRGLMVSFGATSGLPPAVEVGVLNAKGSLFLTRPSLAAHTATIEEYQSRAQDVLDAIAAGILTPPHMEKLRAQGRSPGARRPGARTLARIDHPHSLNRHRHHGHIRQSAHG
jgi:NADPH2:quinone reductase